MGNGAGVIARRSDIELLGRGEECDRLDQLLSALQAGRSGVLVLRGEPGIGKSALLAYAARQAVGVRVLPTLGVEAETELAFAAVHQLVLPLLDGLAGLPAPQRAALETAFGMDDAAPRDHFLVALAVLNLMAQAAQVGPLLCVVEDADWLDPASAQVLSFVARRILDEPVLILFASRRHRPELSGLPELVIGGVDDTAAHVLLDSATPAALEPHIRERIIAEARGNPRALLALPRGLTLTQLASGLGLITAEASTDQAEQTLLDRIQELPVATRLLLLVAAAEPSGDAHLVRGAVSRLGVADQAAVTDQVDGLMEIDGRVVFRHPAVRSAAYRAATAKDRRAAHGALAAVTDARADADRRAWHRGVAAGAPDESVASALEESADRARARGGLAAAAAFLHRSVVLTQDMSRHADRALAAAEASRLAGDLEATRHNLDTAELDTRTDAQRARTLVLRGQLKVVAGRPKDAVAMLLDAAHQMQRCELGRADEACLAAWGAAVTAADPAALLATCRTIEALPDDDEDPPPIRRLLRGYALLARGSRSSGVEVLRRVVPAVSELSDDELLRWGRATAGLGPSVWDEELVVSTIRRQVEVSERAGALGELPSHLSDLAATTAWAGDLPAARLLVAEAERVAGATGAPLPSGGALLLSALVGREHEAVGLIDATIGQAHDDGQGRGLSAARWASAVLFNGLGKYTLAVAAARSLVENADVAGVCEPWTSVWVLPELLEAAARKGDGALAVEALERLLEATRPCATDWALGLSARCRAVVEGAAKGQACDPLFAEAIARLGRTRWRPDLARTHLLYGEWLRRRGRRLDAREHLRQAHEMFELIGMEAFAERARRELIATGEMVRKRSTGAASSSELTPQELQIVALVREGYSNSEVADRLFLSPRTVEWHLRKVFTKLTITSRRQLKDVPLPAQPGQPAHRDRS